MTELGTIMIFECEWQPGGTHIIEDHYVEEVVDPETDEPVPYGEMGERVVTSFGRVHPRDPVPDQGLRGPGPGIELLLRPNVRHLRREDPGPGRRHEAGRGTNVYPRAVEAIVREHPEIDEFQIHLYTEEGIRDEIEVLVEIPDAGADEERILGDLKRSLADAHEGLRFGVKRVEDETLPRFELKAKRLLDERIVIGTEGERRQP